MAGIGFELRKIFSRKTLASNIIGSIYATMTTIGPTIIFMILLFTLNKVMYVFNATEIESLFFVSSFTYEFLVSIIIASLFNTVLSRYISDKIFEEKEEDICASMFGAMTVTSIISGIILFVFCFLMYKKDNVSIYFLINYYLLGVLASNTYVLMTYVSALKEYKEVTFSFLFGCIPAIIVFFFTHLIFNINIIISLYASLTVGFTFIVIMLVFWCVKAFGMSSNKYFEFLRYFIKYPVLAISGLSYMLGLYLSNIIYWNFSDMRLKISIFSTAPTYDMAMFFAVVISLPAFVLFVVKVETIFYERYVKYISSLNEGTYDLIEKNRISMNNTIKLQLFFVYDIQLVITVLSISAAGIVFPLLNISNQVLSMFMILGMGLFCTTSMYLTVLFLYYFQDYKSSCITTVVFFIVELISCVICLKLGSPYYPLPLLIAGVISWIIGFILLRKRLNNLNSFIMCK